MSSGPLIQTLRSRWFLLSVHASLWLLLYLAVTHAGGRVPDLREANAFSLPVQSPAPVARLGPLFSPAQWPAFPAETNSLNLFFTRHFVAPPPPAPPPPPTSRKIELTYQGFYQTGETPRLAILKVADALVIARIGTTVATNLFVAEATMQSLTLTNLAAQTNLLLLNTKKEIEVPIQ
jgi:hypothetical protein